MKAEIAYTGAYHWYFVKVTIEGREAPVGVMVAIVNNLGPFAKTEQYGLRGPIAFAEVDDGRPCAEPSYLTGEQMEEVQELAYQKAEELFARKPEL